MADQANSPELPDPASASLETVVADRIETVRVRRAPKFSVFLVAGAALGLLVAMILTFAFDGTDGLSPNTGLSYTPGQVFAFLLLFCIPIGLALGGGLALILDRTVGRHTREVTVDRETIQRLEL